MIESKQRQLEDSWRFTELLREKDSLIETLEGGLEQAVTDARSHGVNAQELKTFVEQTKLKHKKVCSVWSIKRWSCVLFGKEGDGRVFCVLKKVMVV